MVRSVTVLFCAGAVLFSSGCALLTSPAYTEPAYYDLAAADEKIPVSAAVELGLFADRSGNGTRIVTRSADGVKISFDEYNRFTASPALLVKRRLAVCFVPEKKLNSQKVTVSGELLRFEYLAGQKKVRAVIDYRLECSGNTVKIRQTLEEQCVSSGAAAAAGFEKCIVRSAKELAGEIDAFVKECAKEKK